MFCFLASMISQKSVVPLCALCLPLSDAQVCFISSRVSCYIFEFLGLASANPLILLPSVFTMPGTPSALEVWLHYFYLSLSFLPSLCVHFLHLNMQTLHRAAPVVHLGHSAPFLLPPHAPPSLMVTDCIFPAPSHIILACVRGFINLVWLEAGFFFS